MIELLKYLANNLGPEDLLRLAQFLSKNPQIIDEKTLLEIINEVDPPFFHVTLINYNSQLYKLLKDNDISLN